MIEALAHDLGKVSQARFGEHSAAFIPKDWLRCQLSMKRYTNIMDVDENLSISFFVMNKPIEDDNIFFYPEQQVFYFL